MASKALHSIQIVRGKQYVDIRKNSNATTAVTIIEL